MNLFRHLACLFPLTCLLLSVSQAQTEGAKRLKEITHEAAVLEAEILELDVTTALLGRTNVWPAPDPEMSSEDWSLGVAQATPTSVADWLKDHRSVSLTVARSNALTPLVKGNESWVRPAVKALRTAGLSLDMNSDVVLKMTVRLGGGEVTTRQDGKLMGKYDAYSLRLDFNLVTPGRILRGDRVFHSELALVAMTYLQVRGKLPTEKELDDLIQLGIAATIKKARADRTKPAPYSAWEKWASKADSRAAFQASFRSRHEDLGPGLDFAGGFSRVKGDYAYQGFIFGMGDYARAGGLGDYWRRWLPANGIPCEVSPAPTLRHTWIVVPDQSGDMLAAASRLTVRDDDCLVYTGGQFTRLPGLSHVDNSSTIVALEGEFREKLIEQLKGQFSRLRSIARSKNGRPAHIKHAQAEAVKRSLLKRKRIDVPDWAIDQLARRIAFEVESNADISQSDRRSWTRMVDGKPVFDLAQFGDASSAGLVPKKVQRACSLSMQRIQLGDPIGLWAFDNVFSFNPEGDYITLPDAYIERFERTRPQGKGSLYIERVQSGSEAARRLIRLYAKDEPAAENAIRPYREIFETYKVLNCSYHDEEDPIKNSGRGYWFWYKEAPPNWKQILDAAPKGCGLHRIGPPRKLAPDYMKEAKRLLQEYRDSLGH